MIRINVDLQNSVALSNRGGAFSGRAPMAGAGALAKSVNDFNSDNFAHTDYEVIGGANIVVHSTGRRPIARGDAVPAGTKRWGLEWRKAFEPAIRN